MRSALFFSRLINVLPPWRVSGFRLAVTGLLICSLAWVGWRQAVKAADASCTGTPITVPGVEKKLISLTGGSRPGNCIVPDLIFVHATNDAPNGTLDSNWGYFNGGSGGNGTNAQFIVGKDGKIYQTVELYQDKTEFAVTNTPFNSRSIGIEMVGPLEFSGKADVPAAQYNATLELVRFLMQQYNIPIGEHESDWKTCENNEPLTTGVYGHHMICTSGHSDPGEQMFADFRADLKSGGGLPPGSSDPGMPAGRWVPYDKYARPYSWPMSGTIMQNYGFTEAAQSLGLRYPSLYPKGDPGVVFSTTNHVEPPASDADRFINPNIDILPRGNDPLARAVYATQAGWITYADWAGEEKGYTIQVESDVDGDGQADLGTRYMRLQGPTDGFFAPDIAQYNPGTGAEPTDPPTPLPDDEAQEPTPPLPPAYILEAEAMDRGSSISIVTDESASGQRVAKLISDSTISKQLDQRADQIKLRARGDQCMGAPEMVLEMDGTEFYRLEVATEDWSEFTVPAPFEGGSHQYSISFTNDLQVLSGIVCDRNLYIDKTTFTVTNPNTATTKTLSSQLIQAESLHDRTSTADSFPADKVDEDGADKPKYVAFVDNSTIKGKATIAKGNWIIIRARGSQCEGAPHVVVKLDGTIVLEVDVSMTDWTNYSTLLNLSATETEHDLEISFTNDKYSAPWCDRNLDVDYIEIQDNTVSQTVNNANSLIGKTKYVGFNQLLGYVSTGMDREKAGADVSKIPNANQTYLSYRIMYNNPNFTTFPQPDQSDAFINARVDNPYIIETADNTVAGSLKVAWDDIQSPMWFFCALRTTGNSVLCIDAPNPY